MENTTPAQTPPPAAAGEDKTVAIIAYITLIGFIAAIVIHNNKKTKLGAFHLRQTLGFMITGIVVWMCCMVIAFIPIVNLLMFVVGPVTMLAMLVLWIMGLIAAINGETKPMPVVGPMYQKWFGTTFD